MIDCYTEVELVEERGVSYHTTHTPEDDTDGEDLPFNFEGQLNSLVVIADSDDFGVTVRVDDSEVVSDDYSQLSKYSDDLPNLSAYERNGQYIVVVTEYPFREVFSCTVDPHSEVHFEKIRVEAVR